MFYELDVEDGGHKYILSVDVWENLIPMAFPFAILGLNNFRYLKLKLLDELSLSFPH